MILISFISGGMFCDPFHCGVGRVEELVVDWSRNDVGMGGMWRNGESVSICHQMNVTNISPHRLYEMYMLGNICFFLTWFLQTPLHCAAHFGRLECVEKLLQYGADKSLKNVWNHQEYREEDWERFDMRQWVNVWVREWVQGKNYKENVWFLNWGGHFFYMFFFLFDVNLHHRIWYSFVCCTFHFWFTLVIVFFVLFFISPLFSFVFQGQSKESLHSPFVLQITMMRREQIRQKERDDSFDVRESEREEQWIPLWCLDEAFENSKWEIVFSHSFWYPLQTPADHARSSGKKEIADMIDNFQV